MRYWLLRTIARIQNAKILKSTSIPWIQTKPALGSWNAELGMEIFTKRQSSWPMNKLCWVVTKNGNFIHYYWFSFSTDTGCWKLLLPSFVKFCVHYLEAGNCALYGRIVFRPPSKPRLLFQLGKIITANGEKECLLTSRACLVAQLLDVAWRPQIQKDFSVLSTEISEEVVDY